MAFNPINPVIPPKEEGFGGMIGNIAGSVLGGIAGAFGGAAGAAAGASAGGALGGMAGGISDAASTGNPGVPSQGPTLMSAAEQFPEVQAARLVDAKKALAGSTQFSAPQKQAIGSLFDQAHQSILGGMG